MLKNNSLRFFILYGLLLTWLVLVILAAFTLNGILAWSAGLLYIAYDSFIQCLVVTISSHSLKNNPAAQNSGYDRLTLPTMSAVVPARNEKSVLDKCLNALFSQTQAPDEIIIVDDGSTDGTLHWLKEHFQLKFIGNHSVSKIQPNLKVIQKEHSGKADSLNQGWRLAKSEVIVTIDADTILEPNAIKEMSHAFAQNPNLSAAGGIIIPRCAGSRTAELFQFYQTFEYIRSFLERFAWMSFKTLVLVSGAFSAFRRDVLQRLGGFNKESSVEDYELIYRYYRDCHQNGIIPNVQVIARAHALTDAPSNLEKFLLQRSRWLAGFLDTLFRNKDMVFNPLYGRFGRIMLPLKLIDTLRPIYGLLALVILIFYLIIGFRPYIAVLYVLIVKLLFDLILHCYAFILYHRWQRDRITPKLWAHSIIAILTEPFAFQILRHLAAVFGVFAYLHGKISWAHQRQTA